MNIETAIIIFALNMQKAASFLFDEEVIIDLAAAIANSTSNLSETETLIKIARWESGGFRKDVAACKIKGDFGQALGLFQVHPRTTEEALQLCSSNYMLQVAVALDRIRESAEMCTKFGRSNSDLLAGYTTGTCVKNEPAAKLRYGNGKSLEKLMMSDN